MIHVPLVVYKPSAFSTKAYFIRSCNHYHIDVDALKHVSGDKMSANFLARYRVSPTN